MIPDEVLDNAAHGSFCPKMCNFACPVLAATGREGAAPWALHTTVAALGSGEREPDDAGYSALRGCTGCHACRGVCLFDLDVPTEVRAARGHVVEAGEVPTAVQSARDALSAGRSPYGAPRPNLPSHGQGATTAVLVGCADTTDTVDAAAALLASAGISARFVAPPGCCGAVLADLGDARTAADAGRSLAEQLQGIDEVMALDPHCLPQLRSATSASVRTVVEALAELHDDGRLRLRGRLGPVTYHDPCVLARDEGVVSPPRALLAAVGGDLMEPERRGEETSCSGAGMGFDLIDPAEAQTVARRRGEDLQATGAPVVSACSRAASRLSSAGLEVGDLLVLLRDNLDKDAR